MIALKSVALSLTIHRNIKFWVVIKNLSINNFLVLLRSKIRDVRKRGKPWEP